MAVSIDLSGRVALVAAGTRGIGLACAKRLSEAGAHVAICSRHARHVDEAVNQIRNLGTGEVMGHVVDVTDEKAVVEWVDAVVQNFGAIHVAVANAGGPPAGTFHELTLESWDKAYALTFRSVLLLARSVIPVMKRQKQGSFIAIESVSVRFPIEGLILSNAFRLGVVGMLKTLAGEVGRDGIRVNVIGPGYTKTERLLELADRLAESRGVDREAILDEWSQKVPLVRLAEPDEIADAVLFLASGLASYVTGQVLLVDGGMCPAP